jgi:gluconate kinase
MNRHTAFRNNRPSDFYGCKHSFVESILDKAQTMPVITCPQCGNVTMQDVEIYNTGIKKQDFNILPVLPTCKTCNSEIEIRYACDGENIIVLNGTCGSGKSTVASELMKNHGYYAIDGDCAMQSIKHKLGISKVEFNSHEMFDEIAREIDILSAYSRNIVLSQVILPEDIKQYKRIFSERKMSYHFFLLKPDYDVAVSRCNTRTCHKSITPEYWIKYFYDKLTFTGDVIVIDNTDLSVRQTIDRILEKI